MLTDLPSHKKIFQIIAGPCSVESYSQMEIILNMKFVPQFIRGGLYKMRTNSQSFQGMRDQGLALIKQMKLKHDFKFVTEISDPRQIEGFQEVVDVYQVGARNMYNYELLKELSSLNKDVILKRAFSATLSEWLGAAEYLHPLGHDKIVLCERGIRSFDTKLRNVLDLGSVIWLKEETRFKVIVDPSHAMGNSKYVVAAAVASMAAGADGIIVEVHPSPCDALSDKEQAITPQQYAEMIERLQGISKALQIHVEL